MVAALLERFLHDLHILLRAGQRSDGRVLRDGARRRGRVAEVVRHDLGQRGVGGRIADMPAGHCIALGYAVDQNGAVFRVLTQRSKGNELVVVVYEVAVDLVRDNVNVAAAADLCDRLQLRAGVDHAGRVGGRIEHEYLGVVRDGGVKLLCGDLEVRLLGRRDNDRDRARLLDHLGIADPVRRRDNDLIARVAQRHQRDIDRVLCTRGNDDLRRLIVQTAVLLQTVARRLAQIHQACGRGVLGLVVLNSLDTGLLDVLRGREIRLAGTKADNILAFCLHLLEQRVDGERRRRLYTRCNSGNRFQCHCSALPYVSQEKLSFVFFIICFPL